MGDLFEGRAAAPGTTAGLGHVNSDFCESALTLADADVSARCQESALTLDSVAFRVRRGVRTGVGRCAVGGVGVSAAALCDTTAHGATDDLAGRRLMTTAAPSSATRRSSGSRSTASCGPPRRCSAAARPTTTARRRTRHVCPVCLGLPGALPTINRRAVEHVLATGVAIEATAPAATRWDRKNYFYPDLPKGYQISQYDLPLAVARPADVRDVGRAVHGRRSPAPTSRRTRPSSSTRPTPTAARSAWSTSTGPARR